MRGVKGGEGGMWVLRFGVGSRKLSFFEAPDDWLNAIVCFAHLMRTISMRVQGFWGGGQYDIFPRFYYY